MTRDRPAPGSDHRPRDLLRLRGYVHLLAVRWPSQAGDGMFQVGAAALLLFALDPTAATSGAEVARIVAVTTLPFTVVGPLAGVVIDRWRRQRILVVTNAARVLIALAGLAAVSSALGQALFLLTVVLVLSANRFFLATLGAVLPKVVPGDALTPANAIATIGGSIAALLGGALGGWLADAIGEERGGPSVAVGAATALMAVSVVAAARLPAGPLGPDLEGGTPPLLSELGRAGRDLVDGARRIGSTRRAWAPILALAVLRFLTALATIAALLVFRNRYGAGSGEIAVVLVLFGVGAGIGALLVAAADRRGVRPETSLNLGMVVGAVALLVFTPGLREWALYAVNLVLGVAFSMAKIPGDTLVQSALPDVFRGRVFAAYDVLYNLGFLGGAVVSGLVLERGADAEPILVAAGLGGLIVALVGRPWLRRMPPPVDVETWEEAARALDR